MVSFASLKKSSGNLERISKEIEKFNSGGERTPDERFWRPDVDKAGNGYAVIRFLPEPAADGDDALPWVRVFDHGFQGPGGWYIENSLTTIGKKDPVAEFNKKLWNSAPEAEQKDINSRHPAIVQVRKQKRRLSYIANILVIKDEKRPENEGKVFLYKFGKKIWDKINAAMNPEFSDEAAFNPFDFWAGANFRLKIRQKDGFRNYDSSSFDAPTPLFDGDDKKLEAIWKSLASLKQFVDPNGKDHRGEPLFKSYEDLNEKLYKVLGEDVEDKATGETRGPTTAQRFAAAEKAKAQAAKDEDDDVPFSPPYKKAAAKADPEDTEVGKYLNLVDDED